MVVGYNTNVSHRGRTFHVQTEDSRHGEPQIITLLFEGGAILHSMKQRYGGAVDDATMDAEVRQLMKAQHDLMLRELESGALDAHCGFEDADTSTGITDASAVDFGYGIVTDRRLDEVVLAHLGGS